MQFLLYSLLIAHIKLKQIYGLTLAFLSQIIIILFSNARGIFYPKDGILLNQRNILLPAIIKQRNIIFTWNTTRRHDDMGTRNPSFISFITNTVPILHSKYVRVSVLQLEFQILICRVLFYSKLLKPDQIVSQKSTGNT